MAYNVDYLSSLMAKRGQWEQEEEKKRNKTVLDEPLVKALGAALLAYATGGIGGALAGGAGLEAAVGGLTAPSLASVLPALKVGADVLSKPETPWGEVASAGLSKGLEKPVALLQEREGWAKLPDIVKKAKDVGALIGSYEPITGATKLSMPNIAKTTDKTNWLTQPQVAGLKKQGTFSYTERPGSTRFSSVLPEPNPVFPEDITNPRFYLPNPPKKTYEAGNYALALERLGLSKEEKVKHKKVLDGYLDNPTADPAITKWIDENRGKNSDKAIAEELKKRGVISY